MFIRPIPRIMMPNSIQYSSLGADSRYGNTYSTPITVNHVRVVPKSQLKYSQTFEAVDFSDMLFIDTATSKQLDVNGLEQQITIVPKEKDKVTLNGQDFEIVSANPLYVDNAKLHHWECTLNRM